MHIVHSLSDPYIKTGSFCCCAFKTFLKKFCCVAICLILGWAVQFWNTMTTCRTIFSRSSLFYILFSDVHFRHNIVSIDSRTVASPINTVIFCSWMIKHFRMNRVSQWFNGPVIKTVTCFIREWIKFFERIA